MFDVFTIGSATVDLFMKSSQFHLEKADDGVLLCQQYGGKLDIDDFTWQSGGAGTNTAAGFSRMGFKTAAVVEIGKDLFGQYIYDELRKENVDATYVISEKDEQTALSAILISSEGGRSILTHRGASSMLEARDLPWEMLEKTRWIHLSNVSANTELIFQLFDRIRASSIGLSWNPGQKELALIATGQIQAQYIPCDILLMNHEEWDQLGAVQDILKQHIEQIVITNGSKGGEVFFKQTYTHQYHSPVVKVTQETGAGDAFAVGFVTAHLLGKTLEECCDWGVKNASNVIQHMGAKTGLLYRKDFAI